MEHCDYCTTLFVQEQHNFVNGICTVCGVEEMDIGGTSIEGVPPDPSPKGEGRAYYTLDGRRIANGQSLKKGVYITNGVKVVVK